MVSSFLYLSSNILLHKSSHSLIDVLENLKRYCHKVAGIGFQQIIEPKDSIFSNGLSGHFGICSLEESEIKFLMR